MSPDRQRTHERLDQLGPVQFAAVTQLLEAMLAIEEGDTLSHAEPQALAESEAWLARNEPISHEQVLAELGLTLADWEKMAEEPAPEEQPQRNG